MKRQSVYTFLLAGLMLILMSTAPLMADQTPTKSTTKSQHSCTMKEGKACCPGADHSKCEATGKCSCGGNCTGKAEGCKDKSACVGKSGVCKESAKCDGKASACENKAKCCPTAKGGKKSCSSET